MPTEYLKHVKFFTVRNSRWCTPPTQADTNLNRHPLPRQTALGIHPPPCPPEPTLRAPQQIPPPPREDTLGRTECILVCSSFGTCQNTEQNFPDNLLDISSRPN